MSVPVPVYFTSKSCRSEDISYYMNSFDINQSIVTGAEHRGHGITAGLLEKAMNTAEEDSLGYLQRTNWVYSGDRMAAHGLVWYFENECNLVIYPGGRFFEALRKPRQLRYNQASEGIDAMYNNVDHVDDDFNDGGRDGGHGDA
ncbi:hypothetical protein BJV82DRAFT_579803 [Fennellomyces sp. T-0311]|nr:hypothetical protein BJV82DRAFT_579803 [Fennellomyces sp. T-0311]